MLQAPSQKWDRFCQAIISSNEIRCGNRIIKAGLAFCRGRALHHRRVCWISADLAGKPLTGKELTNKLSVRIFVILMPRYSKVFHATIGMSVLFPDVRHVLWLPVSLPVPAAEDDVDQLAKQACGSSSRTICMED